MANHVESRSHEFEQLMLEMADGSSDALERIIELYSSNILRSVRMSLPHAIRPKLDSMDAFQSLWLSILSKRTRLAQFDSPERLVNYLAATARYKVLEKYRHFTKSQAHDIKRELRISDQIHNGEFAEKPKLVKETVEDTTHPHASDVAAAREAWQKILSNCDDRDKKVVMLRLQGETYDSIAKQLNVSKRTIRRTFQKLLFTVAE